MVIRMLKRMKKDIETIKGESEVNNTIPDMKNTIEGINSRLNEAEDQVNGFKDG